MAARRQEDLTDYTAMFEALNLNHNQNCKAMFNSLMNMLQVDSAETDQVKLLLGSALIDTSKFNELCKKFSEKKEGEENQNYQNLFDIWMNS